MTTWRPLGDTGLLVEFDGLEEVHRAARAVESLGLDGVVDLVPAARTLLVCLDATTTTPDEAAAMMAHAIEAVATRDGGVPAEQYVMEVPVTYDGADLEVVAGHVGCRVDEVAQWHRSIAWRVAFAGFAPGFFYLAGPDGLDVPRRASPRSEVPAGAVGVAASFSGIYPRPSPGGWRLIGRTSLVLWDLDRTPPTPLRPGMRVQFTVAP